jgi:hypothetical protein
MDITQGKGQTVRPLSWPSLVALSRQRQSQERQQLPANMRTQGTATQGGSVPTCSCDLREARAALFASTSARACMAAAPSSSTCSAARLVRSAANRRPMSRTAVTGVDSCRNHRNGCEWGGGQGSHEGFIQVHASSPPTAHAPSAGRVHRTACRQGRHPLGIPGYRMVPRRQQTPLRSQPWACKGAVRSKLQHAGVSRGTRCTVERGMPREACQLGTSCEGQQAIPGAPTRDHLADSRLDGMSGCLPMAGGAVRAGGRARSPLSKGVSRPLQDDTTACSVGGASTAHVSSGSTRPCLSPRTRNASRWWALAASAPGGLVTDGCTSAGKGGGKGMKKLDVHGPWSARE